jgi:uncharacterized membrane protein
MSETQDHGVKKFVLRPNSSLSWKGNLLFFAVMVTVSLGIAITFTFLGAWMVLPFAGLEMTVLGIALYVVACRSMHVEVISVHDDEIEICKGRWQLETVIRIKRCWARISLERSSHDWYPKRLLIWSHGKGTEVGGFLSETERECLAGELRRAV